MSFDSNILEAVKPHWERLRPLIQKALKLSHMTERELLDGVLERRIAFFPGENCCFFVWPDLMEPGAFIIGLAGSDNLSREPEGLKLLGDIKDWARRQGAKKINLDVRPAIDRMWERDKTIKFGNNLEKKTVRYTMTLEDE